MEDYVVEIELGEKEDPRWDKNGYGVKPDIIRFVREPFDITTMEVEFLLFGDEQGRIFDMPAEEILIWLRERLIDPTFNMELALDAAYNFGCAAYILSTDQYAILE